MRELTERQREVLEFIKERVRRKGYPPSVREIGEAVGLRSSSTVHGHLRRLESKGYIRRDPTKPRAIEIIDDEPPAEIPITMKELVSVPIVGSVTAGQPILAVENIEDYVPLPRDFASDGTTFMLRVKGDSMIQVGILDGDYVIVRQQPDATNGDIVVALLEDEATVKRFYREADHIRLQPENPLYEPIITTDVHILGKVIGVLRRIH
ncbi:MAG TPA: transcriptional repressor LexA [Firmicutes bacterium]|nr:transcriptional repressor LexA [Bacillota bacterium]